MELPLLGLDTVNVQLPLLTSLPTSALPPAVAAALGQYAVAAALGRSGEPGPGAEAGAGGAGGAGDARAAADGVPLGSSTGSEVAAAAAETEAEPGHQQQQQRMQPVAAAATPHLLVASPAQVATALADELDVSGLPLGLLPQV